LAQQGVEADLHLVLREELTARNWGVRQLSDAVGVQFGVARRWLVDDPAERVVPLPATLLRIADVFDLDDVEAFRHAGYLPAVKSEDASQHPHEEEIQFLLRRLRRTLRNIPESRWAMSASLVALDLDQLQVLLDRLEDFL